MFKGISKSRLHKMKWHEFATISLKKIEDKRKVDFQDETKKNGGSLPMECYNYNDEEQDSTDTIVEQIFDG